MSEDNKGLISLLEQEMRRDLEEINLSAEDESLITAATVSDWYIEAEKLIRVLANILTVPMHQAINQLRYAGHHIVKVQLSKCETEKHRNLIEAYKHCKRAVYDALDFYVYRLNEYYRDLMPILNSQDAIKAEGILKLHIQEINQCRIKCDVQISYYNGIQDTLIKGLRLVEQLNEIQRESGVTEQLFQEKGVLVREINLLKTHVKFLQDDITKRTEDSNKSGYLIALLMALILAGGTFFGLVADAFLPSYHEVTYEKKSFDDKNMAKKSS
jgi:hypothetical protein